MQLTEQELQIIQNVIDDEIYKSQTQLCHKFYDEFKSISKKLDYLINSHGSADADSSKEPPHYCGNCGLIIFHGDLYLGKGFCKSCHYQIVR